jgi:hypothetical protein
MLRDGGMPLAELSVIFVLLWLIAFRIALLRGENISMLNKLEE